MGGSASRELEAAQSQVRRLTSELHKAQSAIKAVPGTATNLAAAAAKSQIQLEQKLVAARAELSTTAEQLKRVNGEQVKFKREVAAAKEELLAARSAEQEKGVQLTALQQELRSSKEELEALFGRLKYSEQESAAVA